MSSDSNTDFLCVDSFCLRQFSGTSDPSSGTIPYDVKAFEAKCNEYVKEKLAKNESFLVDGYAPFCKHIFIENFTDAKPTYIELTPEIEPLVKTAYVARTPEELPVLNRFVPAKSVPNVQKAKYLDLILYSREQIIEENKAMGKEATDTAPWGIVSVKAQDHPYETPMQPITMMRNALGKDQGGSGVPLEADKYRQSVEFWSKHVSLV